MPGLQGKDFILKKRVGSKKLFPLKLMALKMPPLLTYKFRWK